MMSRIPDVSRSSDARVRRLARKIAGKRGRISAMYGTMLNHPALAARVSNLGGFLRFNGKLPDDLRELVILYVSRETRAEYEWATHTEFARKAGLSPELMNRLKAGDSVAAPGHLYSRALRAARLVLGLKAFPGDLQEGLMNDLGLDGLIELVILVGFYRMIAGYMRAFDIPLPKSPPASRRDRMQDPGYLNPRQP